MEQGSQGPAITSENGPIRNTREFKNKRSMRKKETPQNSDLYTRPRGRGWRVSASKTEPMYGGALEVTQAQRDGGTLQGALGVSKNTETLSFGPLTSQATGRRPAIGSASLGPDATSPARPVLGRPVFLLAQRFGGRGLRGCSLEAGWRRGGAGGVGVIAVGCGHHGVAPGLDRVCCTASGRFKSRGSGGGNGC